MDILKLDEFLAGTGDGVCAIGAEGVILGWNAAAQKILGYEAHEAIGKTCSQIFEGRDAAGNLTCSESCTVRNHAKRCEPAQHFQFTTKTRSGEQIWLDVTIVFLGSGVPEARVKRLHLFRDVTTSHAVEGIVREKLTSLPNWPLQPLPSELTRREIEILRHLKEGVATEMIGERLFISRATVRNHIQNIFTKLDVHNRLEAVALANRCSL